MQDSSNSLQEEWSLLMHHDTITGTSVSYVMEEQARHALKVEQENSFTLEKLMEQNLKA